MADRMVFCKKLGKEAPGLENPPFEDELGQEIFNNISKEAWEIWTQQMMVRVINEYRLNLAEDEQYKILLQEMSKFLGLGEAEKQE